ncbi:MAG: hypothetical protein JO308_13440 [Verrucomicrobia bacterium]|nr:hypothetical protein [Verrucomicrobiota bacterium]
MKRLTLLVVAFLFAGLIANTLAADVPTLGLAELTSKLKLTDQQQKQIAPLVTERDKKVEAIKSDKSLSNAQKLKQGLAAQNYFKSGVEKYLTGDQTKTFDSLISSRRSKLMQGL